MLYPWHKLNLIKSCLQLPLEGKTRGNKNEIFNDSSYISCVRNLFQSPNQWEGERTPRGRGMESPIHSLVFANSFFFPGTPFLDEKNQESLTNPPS